MSTALTWEAAAESAAQEICDRYERLGGPSGANILVALRSTIDYMVDHPDAFCTDKDFAMVGAWALVGVVRHRPYEWGGSSLDRIVKLVAAKQHDYGHGNIEKFGVFGIVVRLSDKVERLSNLLKREAGPVDPGPAVSESIADTWDDIVGYSIIALMLIAGTFGLDLASDLLAQAKAMEADQLDAEEASFDDDGNRGLSWEQAQLHSSTPAATSGFLRNEFEWAASRAMVPEPERKYTTLVVEADVRLFDDGTWGVYV